MNKKGDDKLISIWLFVIFAIIGVVIVLTVSNFYHNLNEINDREALSLYNRLLDGVVEDGYLKENVLKEDYDIFSESKIDSKAFTNEGDFYFRIEIIDRDSKQIKKTIVNGNNADFEVNCFLKGKNFPVCYQDSVNVLGKDGKKYEVKILTGVRNGR